MVQSVTSIVLGRLGTMQSGSPSWRRPPGTLAPIGRVPGATVTRICDGRFPCAALPGGDERGAFGSHQFIHRMRTDAEWCGLSSTLRLKCVPGNADELHGSSPTVSVEPPVRIAIAGCPVTRQAVLPLLVMVNPPTIA